MMKSAKMMTLVAVVGLALSLAASQANADLVINLRLADGGGTAQTLTAADVGTDIYINIYATVTGTDPTKREGFTSAYFTLLSGSTGTAAFGGDLTGLSFSGLMGVQSSPGQVTDLNGDGINDIGTLAQADTTAYIIPRPPSTLYSDGGQGTAVTNGYEWLLGTAVLHIDSLSETGGTTTISPEEATWDKLGMFTVSAKWTQDDLATDSGKVGAVFEGGTGITFTVEGSGPTAAPSIALGNVVNATVIVGGTGTLGATVSNDGDAATTLDYAITAIGDGSTTVGSVNPGSGTAAAGAAGNAHTVTASSDTVGQHTVTFNVVDSEASNSPQSIAATLTVLDHAHGSFSAASDVTVTTLDLGNLLLGADAAANFSIVNRTPAGVGSTAALDIDGASATGAASTNVVAGQIAAGGSQNYQASLDTSASGVYNETVTINISDADMPGATSGTMTLNIVANVGLASADGSGTGFAGTTLSAAVGLGQGYAGLSSGVDEVLGSGGAAALNTQATLLGGSNTSGSDTGVSMSWRVRTNDEAGVDFLVSDVLDLTGMVNDGSANGQTDLFVLSMTYDDTLAAIAGKEEMLAQLGLIYLATLNETTGEWENAILGNFGGLQDVTSPVLGDWTDGMALGTWGVNTENNTVWAVLNHNSQFAAVPEPTTMAFLAIGGLALATAGLNRRRRKV